MSRERYAIDAWASYISPEGAKKWPDSFLHIFEKYRSPDIITKGQPLENMIQEMDDAGVDKMVLSAFYWHDTEVFSNEEVSRLAKEYPDRFIPAGTVNVIHKPMEVARQVERLVTELGMKCIRLEPYMYGDGMTGLPPTDKHYWPVYIKCVELNVPVAIQVGHTGPLLPSECGRPIYFDEVALSFPDLRILACHLGQPWHEEMMILAWKHPNLWIETSARTPKLWPESFKQFACGWGQDKVIWATDYPLLTFDRTLTELEGLEFSDEIFRKLVRGNLLDALGIED